MNAEQAWDESGVAARRAHRVRAWLLEAKINALANEIKHLVMDKPECLKLIGLIGNIAALYSLQDALLQSTPTPIDEWAARLGLLTPRHVRAAKTKHLES